MRSKEGIEKERRKNQRQQYIRCFAWESGPPAEEGGRLLHLVIPLSLSSLCSVLILEKVSVVMLIISWPSYSCNFYFFSCFFVTWSQVLSFSHDSWCTLWCLYVFDATTDDVVHEVISLWEKNERLEGRPREVCKTRQVLGKQRLE